MLAGLGRFTVRRRLVVVIVTGLAFVVFGALGANVAKRLTTGGFEAKSAESYKAAAELSGFPGSGQPNLVLLVTAKSGNVDSAAAAAAGREITTQLAAEDEVEFAASYWSLDKAPPLKSVKGHQALVLARIRGSDSHMLEVAKTLVPKYTRDNATVKVNASGQAAVFHEVNDQIDHDAKVAETIVFPVTLILLVIIFGSVVAALLPLMIGGLAIVGTFFALRVIAGFTEVSIYSLNLTTAMGLGLAIDYSLFIVNRFREEVHAGHSTGDAVVRTVRTAGRTVGFSALTVGVSIAALLVFPLAFLRSFAYAGIAVVAVACIAALVVLPAMLALLGPKVDAWRVFHRPVTHEVGEGFWHRIAMFVMRRPWPVALGVTALLVLLGAPFLSVRMGLPDDRVLPKNKPSRMVSDSIRREFRSNEAAALSVVAAGSGNALGQRDRIAAYATQLSTLDGVSRVDALTGSYVGGSKVAEPNATSVRFASFTGTWVSVVPAVEPISKAGEDLVHAVRHTPAPFEVKVGGPSAQLVDSKSAIFDKVPLAGLLIALSTFIVLFLSFGSVLVPIKAVILNLLSLSATFGAMVWIFQEGHLSGALNFTATGSLVITIPILMFCIAFGLSMDYEVFLLSRIKEEYDLTGDNTRSVAVGLERTGRIVTAAALLIAMVFAAFGTSGISFMKLFGIGLTLAVLMDATLIRAFLVPAFMKLAGRANWWAPGPLRRFYGRFGFSEHDELEPAATAVAPEQVGV